MLKHQLKSAHEELEKTNSELLQMTLELEDRVEERTEALRKSEQELRRHRDHLQDLVDARTTCLRELNERLTQKLDELQASEDRFRTLVLTIPDIVYRIDKEGRFIFINDAIGRLGYAPEELIGTHFSSIIMPVDVRKVSRKHVLPHLAGKSTGDKAAPRLFDERRSGPRKTAGLEVRLVNKRKHLEPGFLERLGNETITAEVNSAGMYGIGSDFPHEVFIGTVGVIRDISDRKKMENALRESEERVKTILEFTQAGIVVIEKESKRIVEANSAALQMIGAGRSEVLGSVCHRFISSGEPGICPYEALHEPKMEGSERTLLTASGEEIPILKTVAPVTLQGRPHLLESFVDIRKLKQAEGELIRARDHLEVQVRHRTADLQEANESLLQEISERRKVERELQELLTRLKESQSKLIQAEKLGALGTLTAGIAHELNNPMMGMLNFIQYCIRHTAEDDRKYEVLKDAERETKRCAEIVRNLLAFSRVDSAEQEPFIEADVNDIIDRVLRLLAYRMEKENVTLIRDRLNGAPVIHMRVGGMQQVFLNLFGNALDALREASLKEIRVTIDLEEECMKVAVEDTGCGIDPAYLDRIFDPFFTSKPAGKGTGLLGLSVSRSVVEEHQGEIVCESVAGTGTRFIVVLPVHDGR